jgi:hypothetical protein
MGSSRHPTSFGQAFRAFEGIQILISTAYRSGAPIWPDRAVAALSAEFPESGLSADELREALMEEAMRAGVPIRADPTSLPRCGESLPR